MYLDHKSIYFCPLSIEHHLQSPEAAQVLERLPDYLQLGRCQDQRGLQQVNGFLGLIRFKAFK